jgi:uncharacterized protein YunC (DUF1805 family)
MKTSSHVKVRKISYKEKRTYAQGLEVSWEGGQWVVIICNKGMVGCGAFDVKLMEAHNQVIAVARGTIEKPLVTCEDLLNARIWGATKLAKGFGIKKGMSCREAVELLL